MNTPSSVKAPLAASALSGHLDTRTAATEVADTLFDELSGANAIDLLFVFGSFHHRSAFDDGVDIIRKALGPKAIVGVTAEAVLGNDRELDGLAGMSAIALRFPGQVNVHPWHSTPDDPLPLQDPTAMRQRLGIPATAEQRSSNYEPRTATLFMFGDPFSTPITKLLPALNGLSTKDDRIVITGGMASGASQPGLNVLVLNDTIVHAGVIGVTVCSEGGGVAIDFLVSQGCRPIGEPMVVTKCHQNVVLELGGRKAMEVLQETANGLSESEKRLLSRGLLMGSVVNEYKEHFGRGDFLVRNIMGFDQNSGGIAIGEMCRVGQTLQFHVRDAATAAEDLQLLLDGQVIHETPPFAALLFGCNGRGERLFGEPNHDISVIRQRLGEVPIAGFFAAGEFGPIGDRSFLHGHTASLAVMRTGG
jgi:small ligand-binding sensory domain FIST